MLICLGGDENGVRNDSSSFLLADGRHIFPFQCKPRLPNNNVGVEAQIVLGHVQPTVSENFALNGTRIVCN